MTAEAVLKSIYSMFVTVVDTLHEPLCKCRNAHLQKYLTSCKVDMTNVSSLEQRKISCRRTSLTYLHVICSKLVAEFVFIAD
jgi:hypothetical protein